MKDSRYLTHDLGSRNDPKLIELQMEMGGTGLAIWWCVVEMLWENEGYIPFNPRSIAYSLPWATPEEVNRVLTEFDLFENDGELVWSKSALERITRRDEQTTRMREGGRKGGQGRRKASEATLEGGLEATPEATLEGRVEAINDINDINDINGINDINDNNNKNINAINQAKNLYPSFDDNNSKNTININNNNNNIDINSVDNDFNSNHPNNNNVINNKKDHKNKNINKVQDINKIGDSDNDDSDGDNFNIL